MRRRRRDLNRLREPKAVLFERFPTVRTRCLQGQLSMARSTLRFHRPVVTTGRLMRGLIAVAVLADIRMEQRPLGRQQQRAGRQEGGGRIRRRRADRDPDRGHQRRRPVRKERRRTARALQHDEADDGGSGLSRRQAGRHQVDRRIPRQRERLAQRWRAGRRLDHVRRAQQQGFGRRSLARRDHPERKRIPASCWRRPSPATSAPSPRS